MLNYFGHGGCICDEGLSSNNAHVLEISADVKEAQLVLKLIRIHAAPPPPLTTRMAYHSHSPSAASRVTPQCDD